MAGRRISGIFVPIQLDTSNVQKDLEGMNKDVGVIIDAIQKKFDGALNTKNLADNIVKATRAFGDLRDSADALGRINGINIFSDKMGQLPGALRTVAESFGGTIQQQKELYSQLVKTQAIDQQVRALQTLQKATKLSAEETVNLVKARGASISADALSEFLPTQQQATKELVSFNQELGKSAAAYRKMSTAAGETPSQAGYQQFVDTRAIQDSISAFEKLHTGQKVTKDNYEQIAQGAGVATKQVAEYFALTQPTKLEPFNQQLGKTADLYRKLATSAGYSPSQAGYQQFLDTRAIQNSISAWQTLNVGQKVTKDNYEQIAQGAGVATKQVAEYFALTQPTKLEPFNQQLGKTAELYRNLAKAAGETPSQAGYQHFLDVENIRGAVSAYERLHQGQKVTADDYEQIAKAAGVATASVSAYLDKQKPTVLRDFSTELGKAAQEYQRLAKAAGVTPSQAGFDIFTQTNRIKSAISAWQELNNGQRVTKENFSDIARAAEVSTKQVEAFIAQTQKAGTSGRGWSGIFTPTSLAAGAQSALAATGVVTGMYGVVELTKSMYQSSLKMDNLNLAFESVYGNAAKAGAQLEFVREISDKLGLSFVVTAEGAKKVFAAAKGTVVEKDVNQIFKAFSTMSAALKLTGDETNSVFLAISQMISKGKVSAEELRLQLAERMPGAVTLFAKSIGVTTKELDKMLQNGQVGLDALRSFALEVQNTYAAGAEGASRGLQAELNRVGNAWFDLKRAFVDAQGTASSLSMVTTALKSLTAVAPEIATLASVLLKVGVASAAIAGARAVWMAFADTLLYTTLRVEGFAAAMKVAQTGLLGFIMSPAGAVLALGGLVGALWAASSAYKDGMDNAEGYSYKLDLTKTAANGAAKEVDELNKKIRETSIKMQASKAFGEMSKFKAMMFPTQAPYSGAVEAGENIVNIPQGSPFEQAMSKLQRGLPEKAAIIVSQATAAGLEFRDKFLKAIEEGAASDQMNNLIKSYAASFANMEADLRLQGIPEETINSFSDFTGRVTGLANSTDSAKRKFDDMQDSTKAATQYITDFANAFDSIKKATKETDLGKALTYSDEAKASAQGLVTMYGAVQKAKERLAELGQQTADNAAEWKQNAQLLSDNENAFIMLGQAAVKNKTDLSVLQEAIRVVGEASKLTAEQIRDLQTQAAKGFQVGGIKTAQNIIADLNTEAIMAGATPGQKKAFSNLASYVRDEQSKNQLATALLKGNMKDLQATFKDTAISADMIPNILRAANQAAAAEDAAGGAKKAKANWEAMNTAIESATKTLEQWRGKVDESKADQFGATIQTEVDKIDKALRSSKGTSEQIAQLKELRAQILDTGKVRQQQIADDESREKRKELTTVGTRVTSAYKKLQGVDNAEVYAAAKKQYDLDVEFFQKALEQKRISQEDFNSYMKMLNATLADAQLRSQTDLYSRLQVAANDYYKKYGDFTRNIGDVVTTAMDSSAKAIAAFARSGASDFASLASAFQQMADQILIKATDLFAQQVVSNVWNSAGSFFGNLFSSSNYGGAYSSGQIQNVPRVGYGASAKGNVFSGGSLSSFSGSIVSSPTIFTAGSKMPAYATGAGLMGEAGPEAIMPLVRTSSGHLGVRSQSSQSQAPTLNQNVNVIVQNNASANVETQKSTDESGNVNIMMMISDKVAKDSRTPGTSMYKSFQNGWGGKPVLADR